MKKILKKVPGKLDKPYGLSEQKINQLIDWAHGVEERFKHMEDGCGFCKIKKSKPTFEIIHSDRIDYCGRCKKEHGYDCPLDKPPRWWAEEQIIEIIKRYTHDRSESGYDDIRGACASPCYQCAKDARMIKEVIALLSKHK